MLQLMWFFVVALIGTLKARRAHGPARPSWTFTFEWMVRYLRYDWDQTAGWPPARLRAALNARPYPRVSTKRVSLRDGDLAGVRARWFTPPNARPGCAVLFFHGGSFVYGSVWSTHADLCARLALETGVDVIGIDYRLAPEHPYPAQLDDAARAFDALVERGIPASRIVLVGDSAGGSLALMLQVARRDRGLAQARAMALVSPWSDLTMPGRSFVEHDRFDFGTRAVLAEQAAMFAGGIALDDPRLSPVHAQLAGLSRTFVGVSQNEIPRDDILHLVAELEAAGVEVVSHEAPDMPHNAPMFAAYHPSAQQALEAMAAFVRSALAV